MPPQWLAHPFLFLCRSWEKTQWPFSKLCERNEIAHLWLSVDSKGRREAFEGLSPSWPHMVLDCMLSKHPPRKNTTPLLPLPPQLPLHPTPPSHPTLTPPPYPTPPIPKALSSTLPAQSLSPHFFSYCDVTSIGFIRELWLCPSWQWPHPRWLLWWWPWLPWDWVCWCDRNGQEQWALWGGCGLPCQYWRWDAV